MQLGSEDAVPELAGNPESQFVVEEVMLKVIFLELLVPQWKILMMKEIVRQVVTDIAKDATTVNSRGCVPAPEEDQVCQPPKWRSKNDEQCWRHHQAVLVHG